VWQSSDISSLGITLASGSVYIGVSYTPATPNVFTAADESTTHPVGFTGGYLRFDPASGGTGTWETTQTSFADYRSLFVRAVATSGNPTRVISLSGNLAFGDVAVGSTAQRTLTISNSGNSTLTVTGISYPTGFSGSFSDQIGAGSSQNVSVTFAPTAATSYGGMVSVNSDATSGTNTISTSGTGTTTPIPTPTPVFPAQFGNISTRLRVGTGDNAMIGGFIITGTQPKTQIVRGIGPSLSVPGALADPVIEVHESSGTLIPGAINDNWNDAGTRQQIIDSGLAPTHPLESALWGIINPGAYTVIVRGTNNTSGVALFEVYDLDQTVDSKLTNISTRGFVGTGDNVMIGGTIILGNNPTKVVLRGIGPSLTNLGVPNALADPTLELRNSNGALLVANDNWQDDPVQAAAITAAGLAPTNNREAAIVWTVTPGAYTAIVAGKNNSTGVALVEAYQLP
jgi:hypothetical protein